MESHPKKDPNTFFSISNNIKINTKKKDNSIECNEQFGPAFGFGGDLIIVDQFLTKSSNMWIESETFNQFSITNG